MNYGLYIASSGMSAQMARQDVLSNNLANVSTVGFKPDVLALRQREAARAEDGLGSMPSNELLERLGGGVMPFRSRISTAQAPLERTGNPLDVGVEGEGFLLVRAGDGADGIRVTRDGRMAVNGAGELIAASSGMPILGTNDRPIRVDPTQEVTIDADGAVRQGGAAVGRLALVGVAGAERLVKAGDGLLRAPAGEPLRRLESSGRIVQGFVESSGVNAVNAMMAVTSASRAVESNATIIGYINEMMGRAINTFARVA
jgi:flagellar basal-body rod protein FlgF